MFKRLSSAFLLVLTAFVASTGISDAAFLETRSEVMYAAGATVVVLLVLVTVVYIAKVYTGWERNQPEDDALEDSLHIRSSGFGGDYYDKRYGGDHAHDAGHSAPTDDSHGHGAPAGAHGSH
jgi:hypothetical protein